MGLFSRRLTGDDRAMTSIPIVDGDGHIMEEPNDIWTPERIDYDRWGDWVPHKEVIDEIYEVIRRRWRRARRRAGAARPDGGRGRYDAARVLRPARRTAPAGRP